MTAARSRRSSSRPPSRRPSSPRRSVRSTEIDPATDWAARCREIVGAPWGMATTAMVGMLIEKLQAELRHLDDEGDARGASGS